MVRVIAMALIVMMTALAMAQTSQPSTQPTTQPSPNQPLADAVKAAVNAKDIATALAKAQALEASATRDAVWAANTSQLALLIRLSGDSQGALTFLQSAATSLPNDKKSLDSATYGTRRSQIGQAARELAWASDGDLRMQACKVWLDNEPYTTNLAKYCDALVALKRYDDALQACLDYAGKGNGLSMTFMRSKRLALMVQAGKSPDALAAEAKELLKIADDPAAALQALPYLLPANDASLCAASTAQQVLDGYKTMLRAQDGQLHNEDLTALANQLTKGGAARPLVVTDQAKALAGDIANATLAAFMVPLLTGDYSTAFKQAYGSAKAAKADALYLSWINAAAGSLRCYDQCYNGRSLDFIKYVNGKLTTNPVADLVGQ